MIETIQDYLGSYTEDIQALFLKLRELIYKSVSFEMEEKLWAKLPSYYRNENFVRLIPFKDHINIEASAIKNHTEQLSEYKITPKGMLQIFLNQSIPYEELQKIIQETFTLDELR